MGPADWERIFSLNPSSLTDDEIEELCPTIIQCKVDELNDVQKLQTLVKLSQETLQYKDGQVESLLLECGELRDVVSSLKSRAAKHEKKGAKKAIDNVTEMSANFDETLKKKNEKVQSLMAELETLDRENAVLRESLSVLKEEMEDATEKMDATTEELNLLRINNTQIKERISDLEAENTALISQVEEISAQQIMKDKVIDEFGAAIDARVGEWKALLDSKDAEIASLTEELSRSFLQTASTAERDKTEQKIASLYEELAQRDGIIREFQEKLSLATGEINENAAVIEKLKNEAKKNEKSERKSAQRNLIEKLRNANDRINKLQDELQQAEEEIDKRGNKLTEVLSVLKKYEDKDAGLTDALSRIKFLENELQSKNEHVENLISVVNKLEMLNSYQDMEIVTLREKLGISRDEHVSVEGISERYKEQARKIETLVAQNKMLLHENIEMKSDIRTLKYKLRRSRGSKHVEDTSQSFLHSTKLPDSPDGKFAELPAEEDDESRTNTQAIIEENEALRQGLHEILDSIRNQDGKSSVEVQSSTLEKLLEALDIRHLAGWYHPAMRLQERLNVVQGSNAELRSQLKHVRQELQRKDEILQKMFLSDDTTAVKFSDDSQNEKLASYLADLKSLESVYEKESKVWEEEKNFLEKENRGLKEELSSLKYQVESYRESLQVIESGEDNLKREFALKSRECVESRARIEELERRKEITEKIHAEESARAYQWQKEETSRRARLEKIISESNKRIGLLECELSKLENELLNSVSLARFAELEERHEELCARFRGKVEDFLCRGQRTDLEDMKIQLEAARLEKEELLKVFGASDLEGDVDSQVKAIKVKLVAEKQRADTMTKMREAAEVKVGELQSDLEEVKAAKADLQERLVVWQKRLCEDLKSLEGPLGVYKKELQGLQEEVAGRETESETLKSVSETLKSPTKTLESPSKTIKSVSETLKSPSKTLKSPSKTLKSPEEHLKFTEKDYQDLQRQISQLQVENENLKRTLEISQEEARSQFTINSLRTLELDSLRHQILDLQAASEDKATISRLDFELMNAKLSETELNSRKRQLEEENTKLQTDLEKTRTKCEDLRTRLMDCRKQYGERCRYYVDTIQFLQEQYIGSTPISGLERIVHVMSNLDSDRQDVAFQLKKAKESEENAKLQEDFLAKRLEIVEKLKDILEQQIGNGDVEEMLIRFSGDAQDVLNDFKYKRRIAQLEYELKISCEKMAEYELTIRNMEKDTIDLQRAWYNPEDQGRNAEEKKAKAASKSLESAAVQVQVEVNEVAVETDVYKCCLDTEETKDSDNRDRIGPGKDDEEFGGSGNPLKGKLDGRKFSSEQLDGQALKSNQLDLKEQDSDIRKMSSQDLHDEKIEKLGSRDTMIPELDPQGSGPRKLDTQGLRAENLGSPDLDSQGPGSEKLQSQNVEPQTLKSQDQEPQKLHSQSQEPQKLFSQSQESQKLFSQSQEPQKLHSQSQEPQKLHSQVQEPQKLHSQEPEPGKLHPLKRNLQNQDPEEPSSQQQVTSTADPTPKDSTKPSPDPSHLSILSDQLQRALDQASERSATINKYESQLLECQAMVDALNRVVQSKDKELAEKDRLMEDYRVSTVSGDVDYGDRHALKSTINSLQKIVSQKEETITRYQNLLKEDREEHHKEELRLKEELRILREKLMESKEDQQEDNLRVGEEQQDVKEDPVQEDEVARMREKISNLQADLGLTKELRDRWHRLAEERLDHMDIVRESLEEQHKRELESYRAELQKWQTEADSVRQQLSETRMLLTKGNISLTRELQERDDKINELTLACHSLQTRIEVMASQAQQPREEPAVQGMIPHNRDQSQSQLRRQLQTLMEKEKMYKHEIAELKQKLSRKYMAQKTQEKKTSQREMQLEKKVKTLEEEVQKAQAQLDREFLAHEVKRVKTAEEVSLWDKQKRWQQTAEKLKEKLKEKSDECAKLQTSCDRLRTIIAALDREKSCLASKMKTENAAGSLSARPTPANAQERLVDELRAECQALRVRVKELTDRLEGEASRGLAEKLEGQARRIAALELANKGNNHVVEQLEKLEQLKDTLEKANVKLEAENFELRFEIEKANSETPKLKEKMEHLTKYIELLKAEKSSDSSSSTLESVDRSCQKSASEMQKTIAALRRIVERLQVENKTLRMKSKNTDSFRKEGKHPADLDDISHDFRKQYEEARKRSIALEIDLQLAEQRIAMLEAASRENDNSCEKNVLRQQLNQKSDLLDRLKHLLTKAAINEKNLRRRIQQLESRQPLSAIPECYVTSPSPE